MINRDPFSPARVITFWTPSGPPATILWLNSPLHMDLKPKENILCFKHLACGTASRARTGDPQIHNLVL